MWRWLLAATLALALLAAAPVVWLLFVVTPRVRGELATMLAQQYGRHVTIGALRWQWTPSVALHGDAVSVNDVEGGDRPPLIAIAAFDVDTSLGKMLATPREIDRVHLQGLRIYVPARPSTDTDGAARPASAPPPGSGGTGSASTTSPIAAPSSTRAPEPSPFVIREVVASDARVEIASSRADKPARVYEIPELRLGDITTVGPTAFDAVVVNPQPPGRVAAKGVFGPWNRSEPRATPLEGHYTFKDADLAVFKGIAGTLTAEGTFGGTLDETRVTGTARIPDFALHVGQPVAMDTAFTASISDRGGDIDLRPVATSFGATGLEAAGSIVRSPEAKGRVIDLRVTAEKARIEDVLKLVLKSVKAPITGPMRLDTALLIPPGPDPVVRKMRLKGTFQLPKATFANTNVQKTLEKISRFGRGGESEAEDGESVVSNLNGAFELVDGVLHLDPVRFAVPGFAVHLVGGYALEGERLDLHGRVRLDRAPSEMVPSGRLSSWLTVADALLGERSDGGGGVVVPISIVGPRSKPSFKVEVRALGQNIKDNLRSLVPR
ncbi:MAG: AsmA-like C-terminal region-containing protein [Vicinamibacterales bacterium]